MMVLASLLSMVFTLAGLWVSYQFNLASGATIIMVAGVGFFLSLAIDALAGKRRQTADRRPLTAGKRTTDRRPRMTAN